MAILLSLLLVYSLTKETDSMQCNPLIYYFICNHKAFIMQISTVYSEVLWNSGDYVAKQQSLVAEHSHTLNCLLCSVKDIHRPKEAMLESCW